MQELLRLLDDGGDDEGMGVAGGVDRDAGGAIKEQVAVDVFDHGAGATRHHEGIAPRVGRGHDLGVALDDGFGVGTGQRRFDQRCVHALIIRLTGASTDPPLLSLPAGALGTVFENDALVEQLLADAVGLGEVAVATRVLPRLDAGVDVGLGNGRRRVLAVPQ